MRIANIMLVANVSGILSFYTSYLYKGQHKMTEQQQQHIKPIIEGFYANSSEKQHANYRDIAAHIYANALRDPETSVVELKTQFLPMKNIAISADLSKNSAALGHAIRQQFVDGVTALTNGRTLAATVAHVIKMADDPLANIKGVWGGAQVTANAAYHLAQHATGVLMMEERLRLAAMYDLPYEKRIQALHGVTLSDTAAMVSVGSLPGIFPNAMRKARLVANDASVAVINDISQLPEFIGSPPLPVVLAGNTSVVESQLPNLPQVLNMTSESAKENKELNVNKNLPPDPSFDPERRKSNAYLYQHVADLSEHMKKFGLKEDTVLLQEQLDYMLNVKITTNLAEYNVALNNAQVLVKHAEKTAFTNSIAKGLSTNEAGEASHYVMRQFNMIQRYIEDERDKSFIDLVKDKKKLALQEDARSNPDSVGYERDVVPTNNTKRDLNYPLHYQKLHERVAELRVVLELIGLQHYAVSLERQVATMLRVTLEDSKTEHQQRVNEFMAIEAKAKRAEFTMPSGRNIHISERYFKGIQEQIGANLMQIRDDIEYDREYHIHHKLWQRQRSDERQASELNEIAQARKLLFGDKVASEIQAPDLAL